MSWRTVVISHRCKLDLKMGYMVIRGEEVKRIFLDEIAILLIENPAISITGCLIEMLIQKKVKVIFCDSKRTPAGEVLPYYGSHDCSRKIEFQIGWKEEIKWAVWGEIISRKIIMQAEHLADIEKYDESKKLKEYGSQIEYMDSTNREGHAAKVYFNALFGMEHTRDADNTVNAALNYGYGILLSAFNREIAVNGYLTQLGLCHSNVYNQFNLSCDLMEPFRILVDREVYNMNHVEFTTDDKIRLLNVLNSYVMVSSSRQTVLNAIKIYTKSIFDALNSGVLSDICFYENEL